MRKVFQSTVSILLDCLVIACIMSVPFSAFGQIVSPNSAGTGIFAEGYSLPGVSVEPSTGAAASVIPFLLIPVRGAAQPSLTLVYNSAAGMRSAGMGWGLAVPSIERKNLSGSPTYNGDRFTFTTDLPLNKTGLPSNFPLEPFLPGGICVNRCPLLFRV
jgi:virulence plasmid B protein